MSRLLFAGDTVLVAERKLERLVEEFGMVCRRGKLKVNVAKNIVMLSARDNIVWEMNIMISVRPLEMAEIYETDNKFTVRVSAATQLH